VSRAAGLVGVAVVGAAALLYDRARRIAEDEGRPLTEVLTEMPSRLRSDIGTIGDDLREAADEGRMASDRRKTEIDEDMQQARLGMEDEEPSGSDPAGV
jgi:hypothetical protein